MLQTSSAKMTLKRSLEPPIPRLRNEEYGHFHLTQIARTNGDNEHDSTCVHTALLDTTKEKKSCCHTSPGA